MDFDLYWCWLSEPLIFQLMRTTISMATSLVRSLFTGSEEADTILLEGTFPAVCIHSVNTSLFILKCHSLTWNPLQLNMYFLLNVLYTKYVMLFIIHRYSGSQCKASIKMLCTPLGKEVQIIWDMQYSTHCHHTWLNLYADFQQCIYSCLTLTPASGCQDYHRK